MKQCPVCRKKAMVVLDGDNLFSSSAQGITAGPGTAVFNTGMPQTTCDKVRWKCLNCNYYEEEKVDRNAGSDNR